MSNLPVETSESNRSQIYFIGSFIGLAVGFISAYLYARAADEAENENDLEAGDYVKIGLALVTLVRQMTELGSGKKK
jgi:positive regulator of sigma E activity